MDGTIQVLQKTPSQSTGGSAPSTVNTSRSLPLETARAVTMETTPTPFSYWPPLSSASPSMNSSKEVVDDPQNHASQMNNSYSRTDLLKSSDVDLGSELLENKSNSKSSEMSHSRDVDSISNVVTQTTKTLHHNLPPIAGITSSHNYRGAREVLKLSQVNSADGTFKPRSGKFDGEGNSFVNSESKTVLKNEQTDLTNVNKVSEAKKLSESQNPQDKRGDSQISDISSPLLPDRPNTADAELKFSVPATVSSTNQPKTVASPQVPTPFVQTSSESSAAKSPSIQDNASHSLLPNSSSSPLNGTVHSPKFINSPSTAPFMSITNMQRSSPSDNSRALASPHSNLSSPTNSNRLPINSFTKLSSQPQVFSQSNLYSSQSSESSLPYSSDSNSNLANINISKNNFKNSSAQNLVSNSGHHMSMREQTDRKGVFHDSQNSINKITRPDLPSSNFPLINSNIMQRMEQPIDIQTCRNPFELPIPKFPSLQHPRNPKDFHTTSSSSSHRYQQLQQQQSHYQQQDSRNSFNRYPHNIKQSMDPNVRSERVSTLPQKEPLKPPTTTFDSSGFKQEFSTTSERESSMYYKERYKLFSKSATPLGKGMHSTENMSNDVSMQRVSANSDRSDIIRKEYPAKLEMPKIKGNETNVEGIVSYNNSECINEFGSRNAYLNAQNVNKNFSKVNGNEYSGLPMTNSNYQDLYKQGCQPSEKQPYDLNTLNKQNNNFNAGSQANSMRPTFLPMPQHKYDLNRQIYNSMLGGNRNGPSPVCKNSEKICEPFSSSKEHNNIHLPHNTHGLYSDQDKAKSISHATSNKSAEYMAQSRGLERQGHDSRSGFFDQRHGLFENRSNYQNKKIAGQLSSSTEFLKVQPAETQHCETNVTNDHHRPLDSGIKSNHNFSQNFGYETFPSEKNRQIAIPQSQALTLPKQNHDASDFDPKNLEEMKIKGTFHRFCSQNSQQLKPSCPNKVKSFSSTTMLPRPKRESPLDLSVKTVRQSADSTAKDDNETIQNLRLNLPNNHSSDNKYSVSHVAEGSTGAPKIDFTPNFSGFHLENSRSNTPLHHKSNASVLPPVESFKKSSNRMVAPTVQEMKNKQDLNSRKYFHSPATGYHKHQNAIAEPSSTRSSHLEAQKRPSTEPMRNSSSLAKIPKVDSWKLAFDQQIEQRLNLARINYQNNQIAERIANVSDNKQLSTSNQNYSDYHIHKHSNVSNHYGNVNMYPQPPIQTSATPYNPSYIQQPKCQPTAPQTPQEKIEQREYLGNSPDPEQIIKQISKGVMPDHKLLQDKNVLSILRSSLEEKEAKLMQLREAARRKEKYKEQMVSEGVKRPFQGFEQISSSQNSRKEKLPHFGALNLERICTPPSFPGRKLNLPRPVDTVKIDVEPTQKYFNQTITNETGRGEIPCTSPHDNAQGPPADLDGLAAFLAARIRTKGELKQVGPAMEFSRNSNEFQKNHSSPDINSTSRGLLPSHDFQFQNLSSRGSPPKLVRESRLLPPLRRSLLNLEEEDAPTTSGNQSKEYSSLPSRDPSGIRSSSEASVFDFKESDSEGEMPVLERQTLEGMRRDRKTFGSKQNVSTTTPDEITEIDKTEVVHELDKTHSDPFWDTAFDMFLEQLEKRPPKRSSKKKKSFSRNPFVDSETDESEKVKFEDDIEQSKSFIATNEDTKFSNKKEEVEETQKVVIKKEPEEQAKTETVFDGHTKLSSSRLKNYRDELLKEEKIKKLDIKKESEKSNKDTEKPSKENKKDLEKQKNKNEIEKTGSKGMKTRGKSKNLKKPSLLLEYDTDTDGRDYRADTESTLDDDDDSLSLSGLESESTDSESSSDSSISNYSSNDDFENKRTSSKKKMRMETRLQARSSRQRQTKTTGMKLRSKPMPLPKTAPKSVRKKRKKRKEEYYSCGKKKKPSFGDGSDFRPGWEEECYKFKQQLRMPEKLISISRPPKGSSVSLPDLDPYRNSPSFESSDMAARKKTVKKAIIESEESDGDVEKQKSFGEDSSVTSSDTLLKSRNSKKNQSNSIINMLVSKYGKGNLKKQKELKAVNERKSPRILPKATNKPELLPTPSLGIGKENVLKDKKKNKDSKKKKSEEGESTYLGYFRKKTVNNFKEAFKQKVGELPQDFGPVILKSRTRTQTRDMKKRATLMEVFGEERPASAPPLGRGDEDISTDQEKVEKGTEKKKPKIVKKVCGGVVTRGRGKLTRSGRPGLRSTAMLRSNKAVQISKRHLNSGRKRNMELLRIRAMASKKFSYLVASSESSGQLPITKKRLKLRSVRRKFRSGFDYIRKKKKLKKDGDSVDGSVKEKRLSLRPTSENVEDIQCEIRNWVINKGLGETILHRAARLGYTDVAAYCLEKMDCSPSPRDNAGYTPLHEACSRGHLEIAKLLLMYGASVSESAKGGVRPLHEAAENGFTELIRLLLSFGADPLLETYTGHTALSLVTDEEARRLIQHHLADVQGNVAPVWTFQGPSSHFDPPDSGYDPLSEPPSPGSVSSDFELEISETMLPPVYRITGDREPDCHWILLKDLLACIKTKTKDFILKQLGSSSLREMKLSDFSELGKCCSLLGAGDKFSTKSPKVTLVPYDDKVRRLLGVEKIIV